MSPGRQGYRWRLLSPAQVDAIRAAHAQGVSCRALGAAYGCSYRTIYRAIHRQDTEQVVTVTVGDYSAVFALGDEGPIQVQPWVPRLVAWSVA